MIDVYYGPSISCPFLLNGQPIEPLMGALRVSLKSKELLHCPSFVKFCNEYFVLKSPFDLEIRIDQEHGVMADLDNGRFVSNSTIEQGTKTHVDNLLQMLNQNLWMFFASESCSLKIFPPFLHKSKIYGVAGSYDIGSWFRPLSITSIVNEPFLIKQGDPLAYVSFGKTVNLNRVIWNQEAEIISSQMVGFKQLEAKNSLSKLYHKSKLSGLNKKLLKIAKECVLDAA